MSEDIVSASFKRFTNYFEAGDLPVSAVELRFASSSGAVLALANHGPAPGLDFQPVDDFIVSLVHHSSHTEVVRDIGLGRQTLADAPRRVFVTPARTRSYWSFTGKPTVLHIAFPWHEVTTFLDMPEEEAMHRMRTLARSPFEDPLLNVVAWRLWVACGKREKAQAAFTEHALRILLATLWLRTSECVDTGGTGEQLPAWQIQHAQKFMRGRLDETLRLVDVARSVGLSQYHFLRAFKSSTGQTPYQWLTQQRIERAKELMSECDRPMTEVGLAVGFSSPGHFSTIFRRMTGMTPTAWRREFLERPE